MTTQYIPFDAFTGNPTDHASMNGANGPNANANANGNGYIDNSKFQQQSALDFFSFTSPSDVLAPHPDLFESELDSSLAGFDPLQLQTFLSVDSSSDAFSFLRSDTPTCGPPSTITVSSANDSLSSFSESYYSYPSGRNGTGSSHNGYTPNSNNNTSSNGGPNNASFPFNIDQLDLDFSRARVNAQADYHAAARASKTASGMSLDAAQTRHFGGQQYDPRQRQQQENRLFSLTESTDPDSFGPLPFLDGARNRNGSVYSDYASDYSSHHALASSFLNNVNVNVNVNGSIGGMNIIEGRGNGIGNGGVGLAGSVGLGGAQPQPQQAHAQSGPRLTNSNNTVDMNVYLNALAKANEAVQLAAAGPASVQNSGRAQPRGDSTVDGIPLSLPSSSSLEQQQQDGTQLLLNPNSSTPSPLSSHSSSNGMSHHHRHLSQSSSSSHQSLPHSSTANNHTTNHTHNNNTNNNQHLQSGTGMTHPHPHSQTTTVPESTDPRRRYVCPQCPRAFARAYNLKTHMATHDPNRLKPHVCGYRGCGRSFSRKHDLGRHLVSIHREEGGVGGLGVGIGGGLGGGMGGGMRGGGGSVHGGSVNGSSYGREDSGSGREGSSEKERSGSGSSHQSHNNHGHNSQGGVGIGVAGLREARVWCERCGKSGVVGGEECECEGGSPVPVLVGSSEPEEEEGDEGK